MEEEIMTLISPMGQIIRVTLRNGQPLFCGNDVARALGYTDCGNAVRTHCNADGVVFLPLTDALNRTQMTKFITEANVYRLVMHSKLKSAEDFQDWVCEDILPALREHGTYTIHSTNPASYCERCRNMLCKMAVTIPIEPPTPPAHQKIKLRVTEYGTELTISTLMTCTEIARHYSQFRSAQALNKFLLRIGLLVRTDDGLRLSPELFDNHYTVIRKKHIYWTTEGCCFLYNVLSVFGFHPVLD